MCEAGGLELNSRRTSTQSTSNAPSAACGPVLLSPRLPATATPCPVTCPWRRRSLLAFTCLADSRCKDATYLSKRAALRRVTVGCSAPYCVTLSSISDRHFPTTILSLSSTFVTVTFEFLHIAYTSPAGFTVDRSWPALNRHAIRIRTKSIEKFQQMKVAVDQWNTYTY